jgi:alpha/beta superfamily hydrolase
VPTLKSKLPVIIYCHGNCGNKFDVVPILVNVLSQNFIVVSFDFSGTGNSEGKYLTLGYYEY